MSGHREGNLILGLNRSAVGTLGERTTRFTMLLHLPRMEGCGDAPRVKNGPPLAGHGATAVREAIARTIIGLPEQLKRSLTWDQGPETAEHARLEIDAALNARPRRTLGWTTPAEALDALLRQAEKPPVATTA